MLKNSEINQGRIPPIYNQMQQNIMKVDDQMLYQVAKTPIRENWLRNLGDFEYSCTLTMSFELLNCLNCLEYLLRRDKDNVIKINEIQMEIQQINQRNEFEDFMHQKQLLDKRYADSLYNFKSIIPFQKVSKILGKTLIKQAFLELSYIRIDYQSKKDKRILHDNYEYQIESLKNNDKPSKQNIIIIREFPDRSRNKNKGQASAISNLKWINQQYGYRFIIRNCHTSSEKFEYALYFAHIYQVKRVRDVIKISKIFSIKDSTEYRCRGDFKKLMLTLAANWKSRICTEFKQHLHTFSLFTQQTQPQQSLLNGTNKIAPQSHLINSVVTSQGLDYSNNQNLKPLMQNTLSVSNPPGNTYTIDETDKLIRNLVDNQSDTRITSKNYDFKQDILKNQEEQLIAQKLTNPQWERKNSSARSSVLNDADSNDIIIKEINGNDKHISKQISNKLPFQIKGGEYDNSANKSIPKYQDDFKNAHFQDETRPHQKKYIEQYLSFGNKEENKDLQDHEKDIRDSESDGGSRKRSLYHGKSLNVPSSQGSQNSLQDDQQTPTSTHRSSDLYVPPNTMIRSEQRSSLRDEFLTETNYNTLEINKGSIPSDQYSVERENSKQKFTKDTPTVYYEKEESFQRETTTKSSGFVPVMKESHQQSASIQSLTYESISQNSKLQDIEAPPMPSNLVQTMKGGLDKNDNNAARSSFWDSIKIVQVPDNQQNLDGHRSLLSEITQKPKKQSIPIDTSQRGMQEDASLQNPTSYQTYLDEINPWEQQGTQTGYSINTSKETTEQFKTIQQQTKGNMEDSVLGIISPKQNDTSYKTVKRIVSQSEKKTHPDLHEERIMNNKLSSQTDRTVIHTEIKQRNEVSPIEIRKFQSTQITTQLSTPPTDGNSQLNAEKANSVKKQSNNEYILKGNSKKTLINELQVADFERTIKNDLKESNESLSIYLQSIELVAPTISRATEIVVEMNLFNLYSQNIYARHEWKDYSQPVEKVEGHFIYAIQESFKLVSFRIDHNPQQYALHIIIKTKIGSILLGTLKLNLTDLFDIESPGRDLWLICPITSATIPFALINLWITSQKKCPDFKEYLCQMHADNNFVKNPHYQTSLHFPELRYNFLFQTTLYGYQNLPKLFQFILN